MVCYFFLSCQRCTHFPVVFSHKPHSCNKHNTDPKGGNHADNMGAVVFSFICIYLRAMFCADNELGDNLWFSLITLIILCSSQHVIHLMRDSWKGGSDQWNTNHCNKSIKFNLITLFSFYALPPNTMKKNS